MELNPYQTESLIMQYWRFSYMSFQQDCKFLEVRGYTCLVHFAPLLSAYHAAQYGCSIM